MLTFRTVWDCVAVLHMDIKYTVVGTASATHAGFIHVCTVSFFQFTRHLKNSLVSMKICGKPCPICFSYETQDLTV